MQPEYSVVASEYYDPLLHPTCADLGFSSAHLLSKYICDFSESFRIIELGAGRSSFVGSFKSLNDSASITLNDYSDRMLQHSRSLFGEKVNYLICDATCLPVENDSADLIISLLGDPYNTPSLWREMSRVLVTGGRAFFTTPSWEWAQSFRNSEADEVPDRALFVTSAGKQVYVPSFVLSAEEQEKVILNAGLVIDSVSHFTLSDLKRSDRIPAPKFAKILNGEDPVVTSFLVRKP